MLFARQDAYPLEEMEEVYTSAQEDQMSDGLNELDDEYSSDEDPDDPIGYDTETSRVETVAQRNRRRRRGCRRTLRNNLINQVNQGRGQRLPRGGPAITRYLDLSVFKDSRSNDAISYNDWREHGPIVHTAGPARKADNGVCPRFSGGYA